jgi:hypothetical protein
MKHTTTAAGRVALIRAIGAAQLRPLADLPPLDSQPISPADAGGDGGGSGQDGTAGGDTDEAGTGTSDTSGAGQDLGSLFHDPTPAEVAPPENATPGPKPPAERSLDEYPAELRDYVKSLRTEAADNRVKAKNEAERAKAAEATTEQRLAEQREELIGQLLKATGLMPDVADDDDEPIDPGEQIGALTEQLAARDQDHRATQLELAIWKGAHAHQGNPARLTDSRAFMAELAKLDPGAPDFTSQVSAAIGTAVETDPYYRVEQPAGQVPAQQQPDVPSGGDFAGGTGGQHTEPQTVDEMRALLRKNKRGGGSD